MKYLVYDYEMYQKIHLAKKKAEGPFGSSHLTNWEKACINSNFQGYQDNIFGGFKKKSLKKTF